MKRAATKEVAPAAQQQCECTRAPNLLVGDSLVARETVRFFSQLRPANSARAFPDARVKKVTVEVAKLNLNRDSTLLLTVGGNDLFLRNEKCGSSEGLVEDLDQLIKTVKSKTSRLIVVGLVFSHGSWLRLSGAPSKEVTAKRGPTRKPPPEAPTKVATVPPPSAPLQVIHLVLSPHLEGSSLAPGGSGSPYPPNGPSKRPRSPPTEESVSPTQGPSQKRRCDQDSGRD